ncbi:MAG: PilZ domain-containing protein [Bdellovibrionota bacterium]
MNTFRKFLSLLPLKKKLKLPLEKQSGLIFKAAESVDEFEQVFAISGITKWDCLPCTTTLICKSGEKVLASISLISDSGFGLPSDQFINLGRFRHKGMRVLELSRLSIADPENDENRIILPLFKFIYEFTARVQRADALIISLDSHRADFMTSTLLFEPVEQGRILQMKSNEDSPESLVLFLHGIESRYLKENKDLHHYLFSAHSENMLLPENKFRFSSVPNFSPAKFRYFFIEQSDVLSSLSDREKFYLAEFYHFPEFRDIIKCGSENPNYQRSSPRIAVRFRASVINSSASRIRSGEVHQIALHGLALKITNMDFNVGEKVSVIIDMEDNTRMKVQGNVVWTNDHAAGVKLESLPDMWKEFNEYAWGMMKNELRLSA